MKPFSKKAISALTGAIILFALVAGIIGLLYVSNPPTYCCGSNVKTIQITSYSLYSTSKTFNFTLNNPDDTTTVSSVFVNQSSCNANFLPITKNTVASESCIVSGTSMFSKGETVNYNMSFADGQTIYGSVQAQ